MNLAPGWAGLLAAPYGVPLVAGLAALLLLAFFIVLYRKEQKLGGDPLLDLETRNPKWIQKKAQELARQEAFRAAGDLFLHLEKYEEAAANYLKGKQLVKAGETLLAAGKLREGARVYEALEDFPRAAKFYLEAGEPVQAAEAFLRAGEIMAAARLLEQSGRFDRAGEIYQEQTLFRRAAEMYERAELWGRAADALHQCYQREKARLPEEVAEADACSLALLCRRCGELYERDHRPAEAVASFERGGCFLEAARVHESVENFASASEAYLRAGLPMEAARCLERTGQSRAAAALRAGAYLEKGQKREALSHLEQAEDFKTAAGIYLELGETLRAGETWERAGEWARAAEIFLGLGNFERTADNFDRAGRFAEAARYFEKADNYSRQAEMLEKDRAFYPAGENYFRRGLFDRAIRVLQQVERANPDFDRSCLLLGEIFREKGMLKLARESFQLAVENQEVSRGNLAAYYQLAVCAERMGDNGAAMAIYDKILGLDHHFQDVADRIKSLKQTRTQVELPASTSSTGSRLEDTQAMLGDSTAPGHLLERPETRYEILQEIGRGWMGIVYKARDTILDRTVAYKVLPANLKDHPQALKNFFREAKSAAKLNHPNIVTVYDAGEESGTYYIAMELIEGQTVKETLNREGKLSVKAVLIIAGQVCRALEYAHQRKIVHRDIKSSNVMWTPDKQVKIMDFGLAKVIEEVKGYQTLASGTHYYMSPEQVLGQNVDFRTDLYSLGITLFEMITGTLPFRHGEAAYHHVHTPPPEAKSLLPETPDALNAIILRLMQKKPDDRYASAHEVFEALKQVRV
jgi:eukaryotic-like serine/threonine-protein kinase